MRGRLHSLTTKEPENQPITSIHVDIHFKLARDHFATLNITLCPDLGNENQQSKNKDREKKKREKNQSVNEERKREVGS